MENILIVEDDQMLVEIYQKKFKSEGYQVDTASSGAEAIKKIIKTKPDLVLLDLVMPEEDGFEVLKKVKRNPITQDVRVIVFSNLSQEEDKEKAAALGAEGFITKSDFTPKEIVEKVHEIVNIKVDKKDRADQDAEMSKAAPTGAQRILLLEDEEVFADVFEKKLTEEGYYVDVVKDEIMGTNKMENETYDLYIINVSASGQIGRKLIEKIKSFQEKALVPIIAFSNSKEDLMQLEGILDQGRDQLTEKAMITPSQLAKLVRKTLDQ